MKESKYTVKETNKLSKTKCGNQHGIRYLENPSNTTTRKQHRAASSSAFPAVHEKGAGASESRVAPTTMQMTSLATTCL